MPSHTSTNGTSTATRYRRVEAVLRDQIRPGEYRPGDRLHTEEDLVRDFGVSRPIQQVLDIEFGAETFCFIRLHYRGRQPFGGSKAHLDTAPGRLLTKRDMLAPRFLDIVARRAGRKNARVEFKMEAVLADARMAEVFGVLPGVPMISLRRTSRDQGSSALEHSHLLYRSDLCQVEFTRHP